jgi:hypothetical protein
MLINIHYYYARFDGDPVPHEVEPSIQSVEIDELPPIPERKDFFAAKIYQLSDGMIDDITIVRLQQEEEWKLYPQILSSPHIPKPLHGRAPRTVFGNEWWMNEKNKCKDKTDHHCIACGIHKSKVTIVPGKRWMEAHEHYDIDYPKGTMTYVRAVPLCNPCHMFIHTGFLTQIYKEKKYTRKQCYDILTNGLNVCRKHNLPVFGYTLSWCKKWDIDTSGVVAIDEVQSIAGWGDWRLIIGDKEYGPIHKTRLDWIKHYHPELIIKVSKQKPLWGIEDYDEIGSEEDNDRLWK